MRCLLRFVGAVTVCLAFLSSQAAVKAGLISILLDETNFTKNIPTTAIQGELDLLEGPNGTQTLSDTVVFNVQGNGKAILSSDNSTEKDDANDPADGLLLHVLSGPVLAISESGKGPWVYTPTSGEPGYYTVATATGFDTPQYTISSDPITTGDVTPEPTSLTLLGLGLAGLAGYGWRRRRQPKASS